MVKNYYNISLLTAGEKGNKQKPDKPDIKPQTDQPEIKKPTPPEISPDKTKRPEIPTPEPEKPEIIPGKKGPDIPSPAPPEPHEQSKWFPYAHS